MTRTTERLLKTASDNEFNSSISFFRRVFSNTETVNDAFSSIKLQLLNIENWNQHSVISSYAIFDEKGKASPSQTIIENMFIRISLKASGKYDWVKVENIQDSSNEFIITVKPARDPTVSQTEETLTSHFFTSEATNNFCLMKDDCTLSLYVIGLSEMQNTNEASTAIEAFRNVAVSNLGSFLGIQKGEWETFCKNFLTSFHPKDL